MSRTLLLADGSITIQRVIELTFAHEDVRVMSVGDGRRAMQVLETEQPDVVLLDVDLPEMDGYALAAHIRRVPRLKDVPVLLLAGAFEPVDQDAGARRRVGRRHSQAVRAAGRRHAREGTDRSARSDGHARCRTPGRNARAGRRAGRSRRPAPRACRQPSP